MNATKMQFRLTAVRRYVSLGRCALALSLALGWCCACRAGVVKTTVYQSGAEGYNIYRIPTIVQAANGDLLAFAEARSGGDASEIDIVVKRSVDRGKNWGPLQVVMDNADFVQYFPAGSVPEVTVGNQSPVIDWTDPTNPGRIWMPFTLENDRVFVTYSDDHGATWAEHQEITSAVKDPSWGWYATGPVHGIQLERGDHAGRLIVPSDHRISGTSSWGSHVIYSDDHGQTWQLGAVDTHLGASPIHPNENVAVELVDGRVYFNARDQNGSSPETRAIAYSSDGGETYDAPFAAEPQFTTPVVQNSALRYAAVDKGDHQNIIVHSGPGQANSRRDMTIRFSVDEASSWSEPTVIHEGPAAYSDLVKLDNGDIGILFEAGDSLYEEILFGWFGVDDLQTTLWNGVEGDVNQDGVVTEEDVAAFLANWTPVTDEFYLGGVDSYTHGDLNFDGRNDLYDAYIMRRAAVAAGLPGEALVQLAVGVPEPTAQALAAATLPAALWSLFRGAVFGQTRRAKGDVSDVR